MALSAIGPIWVPREVSYPQRSNVSGLLLYLCRVCRPCRALAAHTRLHTPCGRGPLYLRAVGPRSGLRFSYYEDTLIKSSGFENRLLSFDAASYNTRLSRIEAFEAGTVKGT